MTARRDSSRRVLVVGHPDSREALAAVRSLHRAGWTVGYGTNVSLGLVATSRAVARRELVHLPDRGATAFLDSVQAAVELGSYDLVFGAGDPEMLALSWGRERLTAIVPHAAHDRVLAAVDKWTLDRAADDAGVATPHTVLATPSAVAAWTGPAIVKPRCKWTPELGPDAQWSGTSAVADRAGLAEAVERLAAAGHEAVVQEPVAGRLVAVVVLVDREGAVVGAQQQEATHTYPADEGISARARTVEPDPDLLAGVRRLVRELGWFGVAQLQFLSPAPGEYRLIDFNGRFYGSMSLAVAAGLDLPAAWAAMAVGDTSPPLPPARVGTRYVWLGGDLRRALAAPPSGDAAPRPSGLSDRLRHLVDTLRYALTATHSIASMQDPLPALTRPATLLAGQWRRLVAGLRRRLGPRT